MWNGGFELPRQGHNKAQTENNVIPISGNSNPALYTGQVVKIIFGAIQNMYLQADTATVN
jgi:hypothetical protein